MTSYGGRFRNQNPLQRAYWHLSVIMSFDDRETFMRCKAKNANHFRVEFQHNRVHRDDGPKVRNPLVPFLVAGAVHQPMAVVRARRDPAEDVGRGTCATRINRRSRSRQALQ